MSDKELIELIKEDHDYLGYIYKNNKDYCISFLRNMFPKTSSDDLNDIFQEAIIILYENIVNDDFQLTSTIQTYLNSVCRFQILNKFRSDKKKVNHDNNFEIIVDKLNYDNSIQDSLQPIEQSEETQFNAIERALKAIEKAGGNCYELLTLFWYHKKSVEELTTHFGYSNSSNTKNQKYKCQKRLQKLAINYQNG
ncbi:RNA polymerase sigma factor [Maribacter dokdonensis]|uniref:RNA polymerase sigma factor n=1 Tax=Maribacter dokdonensis TaxID=320912 RepID=UPI00071994AD|nr:sigma-70 family RNA polymerase sigma factor [Maribacter dokdonensis]KSA14190.1 RNA polymerase sigma-70 factor, ECF subfamily [Maribacter dokdonensis DSW-8]